MCLKYAPDWIQLIVMVKLLPNGPRSILHTWDFGTSSAVNIRPQTVDTCSA